jgi:hypothetical protein
MSEASLFYLTVNGVFDLIRDISSPSFNPEETNMSTIDSVKYMFKVSPDLFLNTLTGCTSALNDKETTTLYNCFRDIFRTRNRIIHQHNYWGDRNRFNTHLKTVDTVMTILYKLVTPNSSTMPEHDSAVLSQAILLEIYDRMKMNVFQTVSTKNKKSKIKPLPSRTHTNTTTKRKYKSRKHFRPSPAGHVYNIRFL